MKLTNLTLLLFFASRVYAQQVHLQGTITDAQTNRPIASATVSIPSQHLYFKTDIAGKFDIPSGKVTDADSIGFSCIGYQTKKLKARDMLSNVIIKLAPAVNMLQEVKFNFNAPALIKVGIQVKRPKYTPAERPGTDYATFMEGSKNVKGIIQTVGFYLGNGHGSSKGGDVTARFQIKLFEVDTDGSPGKEITKDSILISAKKSDAWFDVDISAYHFRNPDSGFFASFSLLEHQFYKLRDGAIVKDEFGNINETIDYLGVHHDAGAWNIPDVITPRIGIRSIDSLRLRSYFTCNTLQDGSWHWKKTYFNFSYLIRAEIAPD